MKILYQAMVYYEAGGNPLSFLWSVSFPVHQVLSTPAPTAHCQQLLDLVDRAAIHHFRRRQGCNSRDHGTHFGWFDLADMEGWVNTEGSRQAKTNSCGTDDLSDGERTHEPRRQLLGGDPEAEVSCQEPHPLTWLVGWGGSSYGPP